MESHGGVRGWHAFDVTESSRGTARINFALHVEYQKNLVQMSFNTTIIQQA